MQEDGWIIFVQLLYDLIQIIFKEGEKRKKENELA